MTYVVVQNSDLGELVDEVNDLISQGFKPVAGVSHSSNGYIQAMINMKPKKVISEEFKIIKKGIVPGETGPEYCVTYQHKGREYTVNLGSGVRNYLDEEIKEMLLSGPTKD